MPIDINSLRTYKGGDPDAYRRYQELFEGDEFGDLADRGARPQRVLWASTSTKNPAYSDVLYVEPLVGPRTVNTMPPATLDAFKDHGTADPTALAPLLDGLPTRAELDAFMAVARVRH